MNEGRNRWVESSTLSAGVVLVLALVVIVNYFAWKYYQRFDWTSDELYTLSEKSKSVVAGLEEPIEAVVFLSPGEPLFEPINELLSRYAAESANFSVRVVDPEKNLIEAQSLVTRFELSQLDVIVFDGGDDRRVVESADLADYDYSGLQAGLGPQMTAFKGEQVFTGALIDLAEDRKPKIVFTSGHGELRLDDRSGRGLSELEALLGRDNFDLEEWTPLAEPQVPAGADVVVIAGPTAGFAAPEVEALKAFVESGGRLLALLDPIFGDSGAVAPSGLEEYFFGFGIGIGADIVIDPEGPIPFFGAETFFVSSFGDHPITRPLRQAEIPVIVPLAQSVQTVDGAIGPEPAVLLETSAAGWGERNLDNLGNVALDDLDAQGPVAIALAVELGSEDESVGPQESVPGDGSEAGPTEQTIDLKQGDSRAPARVAVFGDADFLTNSQLRNVGNAELAANTMNWLVERENMIAIPAKQPEQVRLNLTGKDVRSIGLLVFLVLPGLAVLAGAAVFSRRRR
ncbi:MAG: GldG family protein [Thermoanaerobaculia bacterium]